MKEKTKENLTKQFDQAYDKFHEHMNEFSHMTDLYAMGNSDITIAQIDSVYKGMKEEIKKIRQAKKDYETYS